jgi:signal transduction histidine kinase
MPLMDLKALFKRVLPGWTLLNLILTLISIISAVILYLTNTLFPSSQSLLEFTLISLINTVFLVYWTFWFILAIPPIIGGLYFSRTEPDYYRYAVQNVAAVVVLYIVKILYNFDIIGLAI